MPELRIVQPRAFLREQVPGKLCNAIVGGRYPRGTRLIERELCEALGVSRTSVREALRQERAERAAANRVVRAREAAPRRFSLGNSGLHLPDAG